MFNKLIARIYLFMAIRRNTKGDYSHEVQYLLKAAKLGNARAQNNLGCAYFEGKGIRKDMGQAVYWFKISAKKGDMNSQANLGWFYWDGIGVEVDEQLSNYWFDKAAEQGHEDALRVMRN